MSLALVTLHAFFHSSLQPYEMSLGIFLIQNDGKRLELAESRYDSEAILQGLMPNIQAFWLATNLMQSGQDAGY